MKALRLRWIDYARGVAIILVCYRHVFEGSKAAGIPVQDYSFLEYLNIFLYSFRMPLFFIISGIFIASSLEKRGLKQFVEKRARVILYPYFLWGILQLTLQLFFSKYTNDHPTVSSYLNLLYQPRECAQFWYLYALFNVGVIYSISKLVFKLKAVHNMILGVIFFYFSSLIYQHDIKTGFLFDILHYYFFFSLGDLLSNYLLAETNRKYFESGKLLLALLLPFGAGQVYFLLENLNHTTPKFMHVEFYQPFVFLLISVTGCFFIINLAYYLQKRYILRWLLILGRNSLYIYVSHVIIFSFVRIILSNFFGIQHVAVIILSGMVSGLLIPVLLYKLAVRWNFRWLFTLDKITVNEDEKTVSSTVYAPTRASKN